MFSKTGGFLKYWQLVFVFSVTFTKIRYKQTYLRFAWTMIQPVFSLFVFTFIFAKMAKFPSEGVAYPALIIAAIIPWAFFASSVSSGVTILSDNFSLITRINFPKSTLVLGTILSNLYDLLISLVIMVAVFKAYDVHLGVYAFLFIPILIIQIVFTAGVCLIISVINLYLKDIKHAMALILQILMLVSPIGYSTGIIPEDLRGIYFLNPMAGLIESYRYALLHNSPLVWEDFFMAVFISGLTLLTGYIVFKKNEPILADIV